MPNYTKDRSVAVPVRSSGRGWLDGWQSPPASTVNATALTLLRTVDGQTLPGWRDMIKRGEDATTEFSGVFDSIEGVRWGKVTQRWSYNYNPAWIYTSEVEGDLGCFNSHWTIFPQGPSQDPTFVDNLARGNFYSKLNSLTNAIDGLVFLGELKETLKLLRAPHLGFQKLCKGFLDTLKKRKRADPKRWTKDIGNLWLEQSLGWNPLINDAKAAIDAYERITGQGRPLPVVVVSSGAKKVYDNHNSSSYLTSGAKLVGLQNSGLIANVIYALDRNVVTVRYRAGVTAQVEAPRWNDKDLWGFSPQNFIPSAWNILPWSFLVDYGLNMSSFLEGACTRTPKTTFCNRTLIQERSIYTTIQISEKENISIDPGNYTFLGIQGDNSPKSHKATRKTVSRTKIPEVPRPQLQFNWSFTDGQLLNVAALLSQASALHPQNTPRRFHL